MNTRTLLKPLVLLTLATLCLTPAASAFPSDQNAALRYWRAWSVIGEKDLSLITLESESYDPQFNHAPEGEPIVTSAELLERQSHSIQLLMEAAAMYDCDFGIDYDKGIEALLPNLSPMRKSVQLLGLDAQRLLAEGEIDQATSRIVACLQVAQHTAADDTLINSLVSMACFALADGLVKEHEDLFGPAHRRDIAVALARFDAEDPFNSIGAVRGEARHFGGWMLRRTDDEWSTPERFLQDVAQLFGDETDESICEKTLGKHFPLDGDFPQALRDDISLYNTWMVLLAEVWNLPDAEKSIEALEAQLTAGTFGFVAQHMAPSLSRCYANDMKARGLLNDLTDWSTR